MRNGKYAGKRRSVFGTKGLTLILALMLVVGCVVGGTLAWLTANSDTVTNTFSTSDIWSYVKKKYKLNITNFLYA